MINDGSMLYAGSTWTRRGRFFRGGDQRGSGCGVFRIRLVPSSLQRKPFDRSRRAVVHSLVDDARRHS